MMIRISLSSHLFMQWKKSSNKSNLSMETTLKGRCRWCRVAKGEISLSLFFSFSFSFLWFFSCIWSLGRANGMRKKRCSLEPLFLIGLLLLALELIPMLTSSKPAIIDCGVLSVKGDPADAVNWLDPHEFCFLFFDFHAWYTLRRRWNSSRQASSRSKSHDVLIASLSSAYFHLFK